MLWSRRIDETNRLVYEVTDDAVFVVACRYHYSANDRSLLGRRWWIRHHGVPWVQSLDFAGFRLSPPFGGQAPGM